MTNIADCLNTAMDDNLLDRESGEQMISDFNQLYERYRTTMPDATARVQAGKDLKEASKKATAAQRHLTLNQLRVMQKIYHDIANSKNPAAAIKNLLQYTEGSGYKGESVVSLTEALEQQTFAGIYDVLKTIGLDVLGRSRNGKVLTDMIREMHGEATGNAQAKVLAQAVMKQQERLRRMFNAYGGDIAKLNDYGVRHTHDAAALMKAGFKKWSADIHGKLAWEKITDFSTGKPFAAAKGQIPSFKDAEDFLRDVYDGITTGGWDDRKASMIMQGGGSLAKRHGDHRVLHFASGQDWIDYNGQYGGADVFSAMMGGLSGMARDVALMRVMGPNPRMTINFAEGVAQKAALMMDEASAAKMQAEVTAAAKFARTMLHHQSGAGNIPASNRVFWARFFGGVRSLMVSSQLGSAVLSSVTDAATITSAAQTLGMSATNVLSKSVTLMASEMDRADAARMGYIAETMADAISTHTRYMGAMWASGLPDKLASFTMRATGLSFLTDMRKLAFQIEFSGYLAAQADRAFDALPPKLKAVFEQRGITASDWDALRAIDGRFKANNGGDFIAPTYWLEHQTTMSRAEAEGLSLRLQAVIREQLEYAVPTASLEARAMMLGTSEAGTFVGEVRRSAAMYKSFAMSLTLGQYRRLMMQPTLGGKIGYGAKISAMLLGLGALAIQLKELAKGNDPRPMTDRKFWLGALFQGGGLGIFGDFFAATENRMGGGIAVTLAGPMVGLVDDVLRATVGNMLAGTPEKMGRDSANLLRKYTPFLSSAWPVRAAYQRIVVDNFAQMVDPEAMTLARRRVKRQERDYGTQSFLPTMGGNDQFRMPDFGNALRVQQ